MRRIETYVGQQIYEWAFSAQAQYTMTAIAKISAALLGTAGTVNGLACTATSPATMAVQIGAGEIYQVAPLEATACGTLPQNTTNTILKQGIQLGTYTTATFAAPSTSGQSINYLIEAQYQDSDISLDPTSGASPVVLQFYNSANPSTPWSGPNNSGSTSNTFRDGVVAYQIKAGVAATTGSQVTPSPDTGWIGLWVVTVPFGASSLTAANISQYTGSPILPSGILQSIVTGNLGYGVDNGTANVMQATFPLPVTTLVDNMDVWVKVKVANTGATTFTPNPGVVSAAPVVGAAHQALQGGELVASGRANLVWRQDISSWVLVECTGGALQIAPATQSAHALQLGQATGRVLRVTTITNTGTFTPGAGTNAVLVRLAGGGGAGGGAPATGAGTVSVGTGGSAGAYSEGYFTTGFAGVTVTIGAGGSPASGNSGGNGGNSSFGALLTAPGGPGGITAGPATPPFQPVGPNPAPAGTGGYLNSPGTLPQMAFAAATGCFIGGPGANSPLAAGGAQITTGSNGNAGAIGGGGGGGTQQQASSGALSGGAGGKGLCIIIELA